MRFVKPFLMALAMAAAPLFTPAASAQPASSASVIVVNYEQIIATTVAGRDLQTKLQQIGQAMEAELRPEATAIETEQTRLRTATNGMTPQQVQANAQLRGQIEALEQRALAFRNRQVAMGRDMEYTRQTAIAEFNRLVTPSVQAVMQARNAGVVIDVAATQLVSPGVDATADVISRIDSSVRSVNVTRQTAPAPQGQQQPR
jgi:outer membrane protein